MADLPNVKSSFSKQSFVLGVDIGSVAVSVVEMSLEGAILRTHYAFHHGDIYKTLCSLLEGIEFSLLRGAACTSTSPHLLNGVFRCDSRIACITAAKHYQPAVGSLLSVGGEKFSLITFDPEGNYQNLRTNTSCAAGTGSFLDQQARRLNLSGSAALSRLALKNKSTPPVIASRCSVFAKTDIVHAQQTGYSLEEICDGVCKGLADNIADILLSDEEIPEPVVFSGGVSRNKSVIKHLEKRIGKILLIDEWSHVYEAAGAGLVLLREINNGEKELLFPAGTINGLDDLVIKTEEKKDFFYEPLSLKLSKNHYPDFEGVALPSSTYYCSRNTHMPGEKSLKENKVSEWSSTGRYLHDSSHTNTANPVEVDIYVPFVKGKTYRVYSGIDIGSTSTKAVLLDSSHQHVLAGFYTRTAGRPIKAVQAIFEAIEDIMLREEITLVFPGVGTTGSGRKFTGEIIGADLILDEITAHARAAYELNPETDTIIEIGGQDSKFTTMRNGLVTFSRMNTVCAAGTGSFLEEQAEKLDVPLAEFSDRAEGVRSPLVSDRCTVFMERDINRLLNKKYSTNELLAASLFAVVENYLLKVAAEGHMGSHICFQGATAKNKALVAAFEQKLRKTIYVSKYCHLTGAIGTALILNDEKIQNSRFKGIDIHKQEIPIRTEICQLCRNHCRIRVAAVKNEEVAYGFLCGRDYHTHKYIDKNKSGFDLLEEREKAFHTDQGPEVSPYQSFTIGLPAALHLFADLPFWEFFFKALSLPVVTSEGFTGGVKLGKKLAGAEFCAPMNEIHGHARYLSDKAHCLFLPIYLNQWNDSGKTRKDRVRRFCYYTQFSSSIISRLEQEEKGIPCICPVMGHGKSSLFIKWELYKSINGLLPQKLSFMAISRAYDRAGAFFRERKTRLTEIFKDQEQKSRVGDIQVVLVGRPYTILSPAMNKGIPGIFASLGIKTYFQDMLPFSGNEEMEGEIEPLLDACHWRFAARILEAAHFTANSNGIYPVYITSFRCAPDSFTIEYFKRILDAKGKPYLILQLDEHDSNVGYETRIEAGVRSFRNHAASISPVPSVSPAVVTGHLPVNPRLENDLSEKTLLFPNWDSITSPLVVANLQAAGIDARFLEEDETTVRESMRMNTGQCIPVNAIVLESIRFVTRHNLDPDRTVLWVGKSRCSCNIGMYPYYIKSLFEAHGKGMEKVGVYIGDISHIEISPLVAIHTYLAYLFGGLIRKLGCQIRPYEVEKGEADKATEAAVEIFKQAFRNRQNQSYIEAIEEALALFSQIRFVKTSRPKVAIFGDLYMRDNSIMNQDLIHDIENTGGEVISTPYSEYLKIISSAQFKKWIKQGEYFKLLTFRPLLSVVEFLEKKYFVHFKRFIENLQVSGNEEYTDIFSRFNMRVEQGGESWDNILKVFHIIKAHPDISLFVQTNPAFCCPSLITEAQSRDIERITGVPVVTLTYDGTGTPINDRIIPYLKYPRKPDRN